jgi:hypothetical protein
MRKETEFALRSFVVSSYLTWHDQYNLNRSANVVREKHVAQLQRFYGALGALIDQPLAKDISKDDFDKYVARADNWLNSTSRWIEQKYGKGCARSFFGSHRNVGHVIRQSGKSGS